MDIVQKISNKEKTIWINPNLKSVEPMTTMGGIMYAQMKGAQNRLLRFMPFIRSAFPETEARMGIIESDILPVPGLSEWVKKQNSEFKGQILLKDDAHLAIAGSVKARGGIYEVLYHAETLALSEGILQLGDDYAKFNTDEFREFFSHYTIQVGSTGNLGLSIGIMSAQIGFDVIVHMSSDAKTWKKDLLRSKGVTVKEYQGDYSQAVAEGRRLSEMDVNSYFIDDENSKDLFLGYSTAAMRLKVQFFKKGIAVDSEHPLFVYLPCGVGGAPGGITFGLKQMFGSAVHCFFVEPDECPCFTLGMATGKHEDISVYDVGLSGETIADGLAVGRPSALVCEVMEELVSGSFTVSDDCLLTYQRQLYKNDGIFLEPSACAGIHGVVDIQNSEEFQAYLKEHELESRMDNATHLIWATGGGLMPLDERTI